jgi:phospholipid-translocating ATPase
VFNLRVHSFFLVIDILQFNSKFSTVNPGLVVLPLVIVVGITAGKDGYEDVKRHQGDRRVNHSETLVLEGGNWVNPNQAGKKSKTFVKGILPRKDAQKKIVFGDGSGGVTSEKDVEHESINEPQSLHPRHSFSASSQHTAHSHPTDPPHWKRTLWEDVRVGDFIKIRNNESIPADILICATSEDENVAFVETKNLDGETNLKSRNAVQGLSHLRSAQACADGKNGGFRIDCDAPDVNMYRLNGTVVTPEATFPVDLQSTLLRGTVLRNTKWAIGIVLFTGTDSKITMNSGITPSKRGKVERQMQPQV